jgi:hypothetical protein
MLGAFLCFTQPAGAASVTFTLDQKISGAQEPEGPRPWASITFDDQGAPGSVKMTFDTFGLVEKEKILEWVFNFDEALNEGALMFDFQRFGSTGPPANSIDVDRNNISADVFGGFDIEFVFPEGDVDPNNRDNDGIFGAKETVVYLITSTQAITAYSFNFTADGFPSAAHVLGIDTPGTENNARSGWISTPIPGSALLLAPGLILLLAVRRKFRSKS